MCAFLRSRDALLLTGASLSEGRGQSAKQTSKLSLLFMTTFVS